MAARRLGLVVAFVLGGCIPHPEADFEDFGERVRPFVIDQDGGSFDAAPPPTEAASATFYGACLAQFAFGQVNAVFNFFTQTKFAPVSGGGNLELSLVALKLENNGPPAIISKANAVGVEQTSVPPTSPNVDASGRYVLDLGTITIPGVANAISGRDVIFRQAKISGRFGADAFCGRLSGNVEAPPLGPLDPSINICQFRLIKDGDPRPVLGETDFRATACPE